MHRSREQIYHACRPSLTRYSASVSREYSMTTPHIDVLAIGNAIVDVIAQADDDFLVGQQMNKGAMTLIDEARAEAIYEAMGPATEISGGSAANTSAGLASF